MLKQLMILGASARAGAQSARRAGFEPAAIDCFADEDLMSVCSTSSIVHYPRDFVTATVERPVSEWLYTGGLENHPPVVDQIAARHPLLGNPGHVLAQIRNPRRLHNVLTNSGFCSPDVFLGGHRWDPNPGGACLEKPLHSGGGMGIKWLAPPIAPADGDEAGSDAETSQRPTTYFQRFIEGTPIGAVFVADPTGAYLLGVTRQLIGCSWAGVEGFRYCGSLGPLDLGAALNAELAAIGNCLVREFGLRGLFGVDAIVSNERVWTIEVNPRYTASVELLERAYGFHAIALHAAACRQTLDERPTFSRPANSPVYGKGVIYATSVVDISKPFLNFAAQENAGRAWPRVADIPRCGTSIACGDPMVTVFAEGATEADVIHSLQTSAAQVRTHVSPHARGVTE